MPDYQVQFYVISSLNARACATVGSAVVQVARDVASFRPLGMSVDQVADPGVGQCSLLTN
jgi:hypothetical protein